ncbi:hypothetical protein ACHAW5_004772 [Stephanodiscus triporus]|uniref:Fe2OG dioxygenase domain-containing protein n=1 Tax=Stephanodiscus triporus TaxID=2934178 RepID=A0ABD3PIW3_9STRA
MTTVARHECDDAGSTCSASSADTNDALSEMLGLPPASFDGLSSTALVDDFGDNNDNDDDDDDDDGRREPKSPSPEADGAEVAEWSSSSPPPPSPRVSFLEVPRRCSRHLHRPSDVAAYVLDGLLDESECRSLIRLASAPSSFATGFRYVSEAIHRDAAGTAHVVRLLEDGRRHKLSVLDHRRPSSAAADAVETLWRRIGRAMIPRLHTFVRDVGCGPPLGLNPRLRVLRYDADDDDVFEPHFDAVTDMSDGISSSLLTVLVYLNDGGGKDFDGGETRFLDHDVVFASRRAVGGAVVDARSTTTTTTTTATNTMTVAPEAGRAVVFEHGLFHSSAPLTFGTKYVMRTDVLFDASASRGGWGVEGPRGGRSNVDDDRREGRRLVPSEDQDGASSTPRTLLDACRRLSLSETDVRGLDEMGLLDSTFGSLLAPGIDAVRKVLRDILDEPSAERLIRAAIEYR